MVMTISHSAVAQLLHRATAQLSVPLRAILDKRVRHPRHNSIEKIAVCLKDHRCRIKAPAKPARLHIAGDVASREADGQKTGRECLERDFAHDPKPRGPQILSSQATIDARRFPLRPHAAAGRRPVRCDKARYYLGR